MVRNAALLGDGHLVGADVEAAVDRGRVAVDDLAAEALGGGQGQRRLAGGGLDLVVQFLKCALAAADGDDVGATPASEAAGRTVSLASILGPEFDAAPALLVGETGNGKTSVIQALASAPGTLTQHVQAGRLRVGNMVDPKYTLGASILKSYINS